jgi:leucyl-tRNA synthetase
MMEYNPREIEQKWRSFWQDQGVYKVENNTHLPKYYVLDMFPYPSGAGLHVGHPLGYIASDIFARFKRMKGFNVLHPMGFDAFGLPAEQYAIDTGIHPAISTAENVQRYRQQLDNLGFSYDWSREVNTSQPDYYRWTQWIFLQLFHHYYDKDAKKALPIAQLEERIAREGNQHIQAACDDDTPVISAADWATMTAAEKATFLMKYRLTFPEESYVNWCPALKAVLSNDEVKDGLSERGGHPVERKRMKQWSMRITAYADRLLEGLDEIDWPESLKDQQRNWIGRSRGATVKFPLATAPQTTIEVFTTRLDTIFGVTFMVLAPEHELVSRITTSAQQEEVEAYIKWTSARTEVERMSEVKRVTGAFTGAYCINPFNQEPVPIYIADYVLAGYGTGAVMAVPSGDQRDWNFAQHFGLPIIPILDAQQETHKAADATKSGRYINSGFINGLTYEAALPQLIAWLEQNNLGKGKVQYRMRNAIFSRQRYWGEPVPVYWKEGIPHPLDESELPLLLPSVDKYLPTDQGDPPLGRAEDWKYQGKYDYELSTMPGWAGSSWYWYRYMDPGNDQAFASKEAIGYWQDVDLYVGGSEHAVGHLLYSRFWNHFLYDLGKVVRKEYAKKLINQGMIQGIIEYVMMQKEKVGEYRRFVCADLAAQESHDIEFAKIPIHIDFVREYGVPGSFLNKESIEQFIAWRPEYADAIFECSGGVYHKGVFKAKEGHQGSHLVTYSEVGKMSKSKYNVINPDDVVARYGADCFRMYEMFLGPVEDAKPWNTKGIDGVSKFLRRLWSLFFQEQGAIPLSEETPTREEMKVLHTVIRKVSEDIERFSFNTCISAFMMAVNELKRLECRKRQILQPLTRILAPFAPFTAEELWHHLGEKDSVHHAAWPAFDEAWLVEDEITYPVSINGKTRLTVPFAAGTPPEALEKAVLEMEAVQRWLEGKPVKKVIVVPGRMINLVI